MSRARLKGILRSAGTRIASQKSNKRKFSPTIADGSGSHTSSSGQGMSTVQAMRPSAVASESVRSGSFCTWVGPTPYHSRTLITAQRRSY